MHKVRGCDSLDGFHSLLLPYQLNEVLKSGLKLKGALEPTKFGTVIVAVGETRSSVVITEGILHSLTHHKDLNINKLLYTKITASIIKILQPHDIS